MSADSFKSLERTSDRDRVSLGRLSQLTGFPEDFIKKELLLEGDSVSLSLLRERVANYLDGIYAVDSAQR